jgi:DnaK suppressor protein
MPARVIDPPYAWQFGDGLSGGRDRLRTGWDSDMASVMKPGEMESFRQMLVGLRSRLRGDLDQMTDEALGREKPDSSGNLSNVPLHMADVGTENYDQEFTLSLIENEQGTLEQIYDALERIEAGTFGLCEECGEPIAKPRLQAIPYAKHCIECAREMERRG